MARHRSSRPVPVRRLAPPPGVLRGRIAVAAVAAGALAAAGQTLDVHSAAGAGNEVDVARLALGELTLPAAGVGGDRGAPEVVPVVRAADPAQDIAALVKAAKLAAPTDEPAAPTDEGSTGAQWVLPAVGTFTSGFAARWGTFHYGVDIANRIGTPIHSVGDGTVVEAGPASGFGLWVRVQLPDGTMTVYGHVNRFFVHQGQQVKAGDVIAEIGNRGQSTGPHLHFEVWTPAGKKIDPLPWLATRGIHLT